ncbi:hypothetical protein VP01_2495g6 [Puccinia sorghi]|uniref:Uncharacterized protein n=1 Tax=Puccinia sorghi TaxID=27349 RepID=A0A0L6V5S6_9BASI|nr:hypothetical protein VP01_2495g6 [Puccinia sorghi]
MISFFLALCSNHSISRPIQRKNRQHFEPIPFTGTKFHTPFSLVPMHSLVPMQQAKMKSLHGLFDCTFKNGPGWLVCRLNYSKFNLGGLHLQTQCCKSGSQLQNLHHQIVSQIQVCVSPSKSARPRLNPPPQTPGVGRSLPTRTQHNPITTQKTTKPPKSSPKHQKPTQLPQTHQKIQQNEPQHHPGLPAIYPTIIDTYSRSKNSDEEDDDKTHFHKTVDGQYLFNLPHLRNLILLARPKEHFQSERKVFFFISSFFFMRLTIKFPQTLNLCKAGLNPSKILGWQKKLFQPGVSFSKDNLDYYTWALHECISALMVSQGASLIAFWLGSTVCLIRITQCMTVDWLTLLQVKDIFKLIRVASKLLRIASKCFDLVASKLIRSASSCFELIQSIFEMLYWRGSIFKVSSRCYIGRSSIFKGFLSTLVAPCSVPECV